MRNKNDVKIYKFVKIEEGNLEKAECVMTAYLLYFQFFIFFWCCNPDFSKH